jgi:HAMP domain-containing protein
MRRTAEDVDDLGDFAADIAEQPLEDIEALEGEVSTIEMRPKKYRKNFIVTQLREK